MKSLTKFLSLPANFQYLCSSPNETEKKKRIAELKQKFESQSTFSSVNFSSYIEDTGNESFDFLNDERNCFPELDGVQKVRRIVENERAKLDAKQYAERKNAVIRRNRERKALEK